MPDEKTLKSVVKADKATAVKKPAEKKTAAAEKKAASEKRTTAKKPAAAKKPATKKAAPHKPAKPAVTLDDLTTAIWEKIENKSVKDIPFAIAIQVNVHDVGTFYIAVNADPEYDKQVIQADYYLADGIFETSADEIKKIASGKYDFIAAAKAGTIVYRGDIRKAILVAELIK